MLPLRALASKSQLHRFVKSLVDNGAENLEVSGN